MSGVGQKVLDNGRRLQEDGHVRILLDGPAGAVAHVRPTGGGEPWHLVTVIDTREIPGAPQGQRYSSCTCEAGRHDAYCRHIHALLLERDIRRQAARG